nr:DUF4011 domain-containing protein [Chloroflexia bacterium]
MIATVGQRMAQWQQEQLDLTNRNRLLHLSTSSTRPTSIEIVAPSVEDIFQRLVSGSGWTIRGYPDGERAGSGTNVEPTDISGLLTDGVSISSMLEERVNRVAGRLLVRARQSEQEQGVNTLFIAFGLLKWREQSSGETWRYAPLVLLPVTIEELPKDGAYRISGAGEDPEFNQTLTERLKRDFGLQLSVELSEGSSLADVFAEVRDIISSRAGWGILEQAHVSHFQFHKIRMFHDLGQHV